MHRSTNRSLASHQLTRLCIIASLIVRQIVSRPCKRCISVGKNDTCHDVEHKKRGRPKLIDKAVALENTTWGAADKDATSKSTSSLNKTRVKGKYTKSANYKMPKKAAGSKITTEMAFSSPQAEPSSMGSSVGNISGRPSSYPSQHEVEHPPSSLPYRSQPLSSHSYQGRPLSMHSEPPMHDDRHDSVYYPSSVPSSAGVKRPQEMYSSPTGAPLATLFLTMDLICARVSDESQALWGYHPHDISHKSLYSIIADQDQTKLGELLKLIKDAVVPAVSPTSGIQSHSHFPFLESSSPVFYQNRPGIMSSSAPGSSEYTDVIRVCHANGGSDLFSIRMYVGGGLGTDLIRGLNIEHAYVVCIMARHAPLAANDHRLSIDEPRTTSYSSAQSLGSSETHYVKHAQQRFSTEDDSREQEAGRKISLPPIFTGPSANTPALSSPSAASPLSSNSSNGRQSMTFGSAQGGPSSAPPSSSSYTVPLSKPTSHSSALPSLRTGPLHTARWLYDAEPFSGSGYSSHSAPGPRFSTVFADPLRTLSAPMGGFGVSKYLNRSESTPSFGNVRRHQLPLPSPLQSSQQGSRLDTSVRTPRSLQKDLSSSSFGASFASPSPPSSMKRPLADMADSQDRNRDIDNRHQQDHRQYQGARSSGTAPLPLPSSSSAPSRPAYQSNLKLELQTMPPDHPAIDPSSSGVCPIVHGSQRREQIQQAQMQASQVAREVEMKENRDRRIEEGPAPCRWAKMSDQWKECRDHGPPGHDCSSPQTTPGFVRDREHGQAYEGQERGERDHCCPRVREHSADRAYFGSRPVNTGGQRYMAESQAGGAFSSPGDEKSLHDNTNLGKGYSHHNHNHNDNQANGVNPFNTGPTTPTDSHHRSSSSLRRTSSVGRSSFISRSSNGSLICLSGACGSICRCSGEDEETRAVKAMDAARKQQSHTPSFGMRDDGLISLCVPSFSSIRSPGKAPSTLPHRIATERNTVLTMPVEKNEDDAGVFTLVCGHLSSRICLTPEPKRSRLDGTTPPAENLESEDSSGSEIEDDSQDRENSVADSEKETDMDLDQVQEIQKNGGHAANTTATASIERSTKRKRRIRGLGPVQRQTLYNQGSVLASDLSIIGFMKLKDIQSPPVLSRHWITLDRPQGQDAVADNTKEEAATAKMEDSSSSSSITVDLKAPKTDDTLAATLFPVAPHTSRQQQQASFQSKHQQPNQHQPINNQFQQRQQYHQQQYQQFQHSFGGQQSGMMMHMPFPPPSLPPTSSIDQIAGGSLAGPQQINEKDPDLLSKRKEIHQPPHLYSTLFKSLNQEAMVAIVALQYPSRNCVRLRKWRHSHQDEVHHKGQKSTSSVPSATATATSTTSSPAPASLLSKRISHSQGSSPNTSASSLTSDLNTAGMGPVGSSLSFGQHASSTALKDDLGSALSVASLTTVTESDREWCGILMAAPHFLASTFHSAPVRLGGDQEHSESPSSRSDAFVLLTLPRNSGKGHAPWLPDLNRDRPVFPLQHETPEAARLLLRPLDKDDKTPKIGSPELTLKGMEQFGNIRTLLKDIRTDMKSLFSDNDPGLWEQYLGEQIRYNLTSLKSIEKVCGFEDGFRCALRIFDSLLSPGDLSGLKCSDLLKKDSELSYPSDSEESLSKGLVTAFGSALESELPKRKKEKKDKKDKKDKKAKKHKKDGKRLKHRNHKHDESAAGATEENEDEEDGAVEDGEEEEEEEEEIEEEDAELEGGSVPLRRPTKQEPVEHPLKNTVEQELEPMRPREAAILPPPAVAVAVLEGPLESEAEDDEQDLVMEQSSVKHTRRSPAHAYNGSRQGPESTFELPPGNRPKTEGSEVPRLKSPGMAPQKRRRELMDDISDDSSSAEGAAVVAANTVSAPGDRERKMSLQGSSSNTSGGQGATASLSASTKATKKSKRIKAEPVAEPVQLHISQPVEHTTLPDEHVMADSTRIVAGQHSQPEQQEQEQQPQQSKARAKQRPSIEEEQQLQQQPYEQPRLSSPAIVNQHQRTPSGTPQWLAANSTPSLITNLKVPSRTKKTGTLQQQHQPYSQQQQQQPLQIQSQQQQPQQQQQQQQSPRIPQSQQQTQTQRIQQQQQQQFQEPPAHAQEQRQERFMQQQQAPFPSTDVPVELTAVRYNAGMHPQSRLQPNYYAEPVAPPEMHQRHSLETLRGPDPRQDPTTYPSRTRTPPQYQRHAPGSVLPMSAPRSQPDHLDQPYGEHGPSESNYAPAPGHQPKAGAMHSVPATEDTLDMQQRQQRDYEQRQERKFMKKQMMQKHLEQSQRAQQEHLSHPIQTEHPGHIAQQQRDPQREPQRESMHVQRQQQEWGYSAEPTPRHSHGPPSHESRSAGNFTGQPLSAQELHGYSNGGQHQHQHQGQPQQSPQYHQQRAQPMRDPMQSEPAGSPSLTGMPSASHARQGRPKVMAEILHVEGEERGVEKRHNVQQQDLYLQQQQQRPCKGHRPSSSTRHTTLQLVKFLVPQGTVQPTILGIALQVVAKISGW
ncbi:hypothetical protein BGX28_000483 [Mortierella sp. GBA30]|nr:hypothetical protein BGX28_000483 [Mortierella sp. GBA30]